MDEEQPKHTPGPYQAELIASTKDVRVVSLETGEHVAHVLTRDSGHEKAPDDDTALYNASLFAAAPRMREALEVVLEREFEPMHPQVAEAVRGIIAYVDHGRHGAIHMQRQMDVWLQEIRREIAEEQLQAEAAEKDTEEETQEEDDENFAHSY